LQRYNVGGKDIEKRLDDRRPVTIAGVFRAIEKVCMEEKSLELGEFF
jgi:hypothetical protein